MRKQHGGEGGRREILDPPRKSFREDPEGGKLWEMKATKEGALFLEPALSRGFHECRNIPRSFRDELQFLEAGLKKLRS